MKRCKKCGIEKCLESFHRSKTKADGRVSDCKDCRAQYRAAYYESHRLAEAAGNAAYRSQHKDRLRRRSVARIAQWRSDNPELQRLIGRAHAAVQRAVKRGVLVKPKTCDECHQTGRITAAHDDYSSPIDVRWLCWSCHVRWDRSQPKLQATHEFADLDALIEEARLQQHPSIDTTFDRLIERLAVPEDNR